MNTLEEHYLSDEQVADIVQDISDRMKFPIMGAGGGFAPIGTIAYFDGTSAPQGWLLCNGQTLNITDYPELAAYFASHHGSSNYYGGNGTTTFAVPTKKGMPNNEDANESTSEHIVGVWTDGKPLYEKTINFGTLPNNTTKSVTHGISNVSTWVSGEGMITSPSDSAPIVFAHTTSLVNNITWYVTSTNITFQTGSNRTNYSAYVTLRYTKTTDSAVAAGHSADGNGVFCIKATVAGDPNGHVYSTEEHVVGQWIDGKTLYEKTVSCGALPNATEKSVAHGISDLKRVIDMSAYCYNPSTSQTLFITHAGTNALTTTIGLYVKGDNITIVTGNDRRSYTECYVTLQYTKTS